MCVCASYVSANDRVYVKFRGSKSGEFGGQKMGGQLLHVSLIRIMLTESTLKVLDSILKFGLLCKGFLGLGNPAETRP